MDASYEGVEIRVGHEAAEICAMCGAHHDHPRLGNAPHSGSLCWASYLIHHNHLKAQISGLGHTVLHIARTCGQFVVLVCKLLISLCWQKRLQDAP